MFEKSSLRTRLSFFLAISQLSGRTLTLRPDELHLSKGGESIEDTAKILSSFGDAFMLRTDNDEKLEEFKKHLTIPIINGLSPSSHPTQILSDVFTVEEIKKKPISKLNITWIGDSNNVLNSLIAASIKFSFKLKVGCPKKYQPNKNIMNYIKKNYCDIATLASEFKNDKEYSNENNVKVRTKDILNKNKFVEANDFFRKNEMEKEKYIYHHVGIYAFTKQALLRYVSLKRTKKELNRNLEQIRALDNNMKIHVGHISSSPLSVDTDEDYLEIKKIMEYKN